MKTTNKTIEVMPQVCPSLSECRVLAAHAIVNGCVERTLGDVYAEDIVYSLFDYETSWSMKCEVMDEHNRVMTVFKWDAAGHDCEARIYPCGNYDTRIGVNIYIGEMVCFTDSWSIEELYDNELIDLEDDYDD